MHEQIGNGGQAIVAVQETTPEEASRQTRRINGVIYCRVSSKEQTEGTSLESQEAACREYAERHNVNVLKVFVERGESAKVADRTQLIELIEFCRESKNEVRELLVWKLDRFARNVGDHFNIKATLMKYGVQVVSVTEPIDAKPEGKLMETILAGFAQFDNDIRALRTVQGMRRRIQEGIFPWKAPLGYKPAARDGAKKSKPDEPDQPLFGLLQKAWQEFAKGIHTKAEMMRLVDAWGIQTANGVSMPSQSLDNFFRNKFYAGILVDPWSGEERQGLHVPMVSPEVFAQVQEVISRRERSISHHKERPEFPLRGVARCDACRHYVTGAFSRGRSRLYGYYRCASRVCRVRQSYPAEAVHGEFESLLDRIAPKPELLEKLGELILRSAEESRVAWKARKVPRDAEIAKLNRQVQELIRMRTQGLITDEEFLRQKSAILGRQRALAELPLPDRLDSKRLAASLEEITSPLSRLRDTWNSLQPRFRRRFNQLVLPVGFVTGESRTAELGLLFRLCSGFGEANSHEVPLRGERLNRLYQAIQAFADLFRSLEEGKKAA